MDPRRSDRLTRRIAITLQKGGVGKTSVAVNLAGALAADQGLRTVLVDMDAQCNATTHMLGDDFAGPTLSGVLRGELALADALVPCHHPNLRVLPGAADLVAFERGSDDPRRARTILGVRDTLAEAIPAETEVVLIDTPPGGGLWLQAALAAAHGFVVVAWPDGFSASGILALMNTVDQVREAYNPDLAIDGLILNHVRHTSGHRGYTEVFSDIYRDTMLSPPLPVRSVISDARDAAMPVEFFERRYRTSSKAAPIFRELAAQLAQRTGLRASATVTQAA
jgi:chromosome partitioning protein